jgi:hypothetical protein
LASESVAHNPGQVDELDFAGWNGAGWEGVFTRYHTDDVLVDVHGQAPTHGIREHIQRPRFTSIAGAGASQSPLCNRHAAGHPVHLPAARAACRSARTRSAGPARCTRSWKAAQITHSRAMRRQTATTALMHLSSLIATRARRP